MNKFLVVCIIFLSLISFSYANTGNYTEKGYSDKSYSSGSTRFNTQIDTSKVNLFGYSINEDSNSTGVWGDFGLNGNREYISCQNSLLISLDKTFSNAVASLQIYPCLEIQETTYNGLTYFVTEEKNTTRYLTGVYLYNGTAFTRIAYHQIYNLTSNNIFPVKTGCNNGICVEVMTGYNNMVADYFTVTDNTLIPNGANLNAQTYVNCPGGGGTNGFNYPYNVQLVRGDVNKDGVTDYTFSYFATCPLLDQYYYGLETAQIVTENSTTYVKFLNTETGAQLFPQSLSGFQNTIFECNIGNPEAQCNAITNPMIGKFTDVNNQNAVFGVKKSSNTFIIITANFNTNTNLWEIYKYAPQLALSSFSNGNILSDPFKTKVFPQTSGNDYCITAYKSSDNSTYVDCATNFNTGLFNLKTKIYIAATNPTINSSIFAGSQSGILSINPFVPSYSQTQTFSIEADSNNNVREFSLPFGVYEQDQQGATSFLYAENWLLKPIYSFNTAPVTVTPADMFRKTFFDFVLQTPTSIFYLTDGQLNQNAKIADGTYGTINPCILVRPANTSTRLDLIVKITDAENDNVRGRAFLYYNDPNFQETSNTTLFLPSGSYMTFTFKTNETPSENNILRLEVQDDNSDHINVWNSYEWIFSVQPNGANYGECTSSLVNTPQINQTITSGGITETSTFQDNSVKTFFIWLANLLNIPTLLLVLILIFFTDLVVIIVSITQKVSKNNMIAVALLTGLVDAIMVIIATLIGIISPAFIIAITIIGVIFVVLFIVSKFNKSSSGG